MLITSGITIQTILPLQNIKVSILLKQGVTEKQATNARVYLASPDGRDISLSKISFGKATNCYQLSVTLPSLDIWDMLYVTNLVENETPEEVVRPTQPSTPIVPDQPNVPTEPVMPTPQVEPTEPTASEVLGPSFESGEKTINASIVAGLVGIVSAIALI